MRYLLCFMLLMLYIACGKQGTRSSHHAEVVRMNAAFFAAPTDTKPYRSTSPLGATTQHCVYGVSEASSCTAGELPLLGASGRTVTIDDILERTVVSHQFLGDNFREVLTALDPRALALFSAVAGVVISDKVNPSFFNADSATMYIAARYLWRTPEEYAQLDHPADPRSVNYEHAFRFSYDSDYLIGENFVPTVGGTHPRSAQAILLNVSRLLYHELTHANDFYPRGQLPEGASDQKTYYAMISDIIEHQTRLSDHIPSSPRSQLMKKIARVFQTGSDPEGLRSVVTAETVVAEFRGDVANDEYSYFNAREDAAMLVEEALMFHLHGAVRVFGVVKLTADGRVDTPDPHALFWAQTGIIFTPSIRARADYLLENIFSPELRSSVDRGMEGRQTRTFSEGVTWGEIARSNR